MKQLFQSMFFTELRTIEEYEMRQPKKIIISTE